MEDLHIYLLLLLLAWSVFNKYFIRKLRNLPPTPSSVLKIIGYRCIFKQPIHRTLSQISAHHGPILLLRIGCRRVLLISSSSAAEELFTKNDVIFANRPQMLAGQQFGHNYTNLAWAPYGVRWRHLRHVSCMDILPINGRPDQQEALSEEVKLMLGRLLKTENQKVDMKSMFQELVLNVMMRMFAGKRYLENKPMVEDLLEYATQSFRITTEEPDVGYFMPILKTLGLTRRLELRCKVLQKKGDSLMDELIEEIRTNMSDFSEGSSEKEKKAIEFLLARQYPDELIIGLVLVFMSAGTDTSAGILEWALALLLNHPEVLQKAQNEIHNYVGNDRLLDHSDIEHLPYLNCIIKETMRLYPAAPLLVPHESSLACTIGGYNIPKGTMLMVNVWAIHTDPKVWVDEPTKFKPERFEKVVEEKNGFKLMPFGFGRRSCPGKHMALHVIGLALGSLLHCFDWESDGNKMVDLTEQTGLALLKANPLMGKCRPRPSMTNQLSKI